MFGGNLNFDHRFQEWSIFKNRFTQFCTPNNIADKTDESGERRRVIFLMALTEDTYRVIRDLAFPKVVEDVNFKQLLSSLNKHLPKKSSFAERYKFCISEQRPDENLGEWAARVSGLAQHCGFKNELDITLRDHFVLGLENAKEKEKLFAKSVEEFDNCACSIWRRMFGWHTSLCKTQRTNRWRRRQPEATRTS